MASFLERGMSGSHSEFDRVTAMASMASATPKMSASAKLAKVNEAIMTSSPIVRS